MRRCGLTQRGRTTVSHADLNRQKLREARTTTMIKVVGVIQEIRERLKRDSADPLAASRIDELEEMCAGSYGSMIRWALTTLLYNNPPNA